MARSGIAAAGRELRAAGAGSGLANRKIGSTNGLEAF